MQASDPDGMEDCSPARRNVADAMEHVPGRHSNTASICRKCYIDPGIFDAYLDDTLAAGMKQKIDETLADDQASLSRKETGGRQ